MRRVLIVAIVLAGALLLLVLNPAWVELLWRMFSVESMTEVAAYLRSFGAWTPVISILLMILQAVISPLPGSLVASANGIVFGIWWGTLLSWVGGILGGAASFWLARWLGQGAVARLAGGKRLDQANRLSESEGFWIILIARLIPLISFDWISYLAGVSRMRFTHFLLATAVGMLPGTFAWTMLGHDLLVARDSAWRISLIGIFMVLACLAGRWWMRRQRGRFDLES